MDNCFVFTTVYLYFNQNVLDSSHMNSWYMTCISVCALFTTSTVSEPGSTNTQTDVDLACPSRATFTSLRSSSRYGGLASQTGASPCSPLSCLPVRRQVCLCCTTHAVTHRNTPGPADATNSTSPPRRGSMPSCSRRHSAKL
jgi:hypothetical protein